MVRSEIVGRKNMPECRKVGYRTVEAALIVANRRLSCRRADAPDSLRVYECPACGKFHLTKQRREIL